MKVRVLLHDVFGKGGGVLTVTLGLAEALAATHDVEIVSLFGGDSDPVHRIGSDLPRKVLVKTSSLPSGAEAERLGLRDPSRVIPRKEPRSASYSRYTDNVLAEYLSSIKGGALITMQPGMNIVSARLGSPDFIRVAQDHRPFIERPMAIRKQYQRYASGFDAFLTLTAEDEERYREFLGTGTRVARMLNGTPLYPGPPSTLDSKVVLAAGRLERSKGFDLLIDAWRIVAHKHPDWSLRIYGEGSQAGALQAKIVDAALGDRLQLMGFSTELQSRMAEASLFVLSSRAEGYGMVLVEAMACGLPVVSTDAPFGPAEIVDHDVDGLLVPNQDVEALADGILHMIDLPRERRLAMGAAARAKANARSYPVVAERWLELLAECEADRQRHSRPTTHVWGRLKERASRRLDQLETSGRNGRKAAPVKSGPRRRAVALVLNPSSTAEAERTYVIFGTRRGGTSMAAGIARALGLDLGQPGARKNNEDPRFHAHPAAHLRQVVSERNQEQPVWGWKYPAAGGYLPEIYNDLRNPYFIVVYRDPVAAALSQQRLDRGDNARTSRLALHESTANNATNTGFVLASDRPCLLISNEKALAHPRRLIDEVADFLHVARPDDELREKILAYIQPGQYKSFDEFFPRT